MTSHHHHYISQCYLKGFTEGRSKKSKLIVIDLKNKKHFKTVPRNVGGERDFNRINAVGASPDVLENLLSEFEARAAPAIQRVDAGGGLDGKDKSLILTMMAAFALRSPAQRAHLAESHKRLFEIVMGLSLATKDRWEEQIGQAKKAGHVFPSGISYEECKRFFESKEYNIEVAREHLISLEIAGIEAIFPFLMARNWGVIRANDQSGPFISSDNPVALCWSDTTNIPAAFVNSPGFGLKNTEVFFPLTQDVALVGTFGGVDLTITATKEAAAAVNSIVFHCVRRQIYAPKLNFLMRSPSGSLTDGKELLRQAGF